MDEQKLKKLQGWVEEARRMVFFGGAGVSTESGIPDFRGEDGLYRQRYAYPPETIISHSFVHGLTRFLRGRRPRAPGRELSSLRLPHSIRFADG